MTTTDGIEKCTHCGMWLIAEERAGHGCETQIKRIVSDGTTSWGTADGLTWFKLSPEVKRPDKSPEDEPLPSREGIVPSEGVIGRQTSGAETREEPKVVVQRS